MATLKISLKKIVEPIKPKNTVFIPSSNKYDNLNVIFFFTLITMLKNVCDSIKGGYINLGDACRRPFVLATNSRCL